MLIISVSVGNTEPEKHAFRSDSVTIGSSDNANLKIDVLKSEHFEIHKQDDNNSYVIKNLYNEDAVSLDGGNFEEAVLKNGSQLVTDEVTLLFSIEEERTEEERAIVAEGFSITDSEEEFNIDSELEKIDALFGEESAPEKKEVDDLDIDALFEEVMKDVNSLSEEAASSEQEDSQEEELPAEELELTFAQEEDLADLIGEMEEGLNFLEDSDSNTNTPETRSQEERITIESHLTDRIENYEEFDDSAIFSHKENVNDNRKRLIQVAVILIAMLSLVTVGSYLSISKENKEQERIACGGITDIAMGFLHAQMTNHSPQEGDWLASTYLNEHLSAIMSAKQRSHSTLQKNGLLATEEYTLNVLPLEEGHFLVSALPKNTLKQFFVPKKAFQVDSRNMQLISNSAQQALNDQKQIEKKGLFAPSLSGQMLTLNAIAAKLESSEYHLPKNMATTEASYYLYNAPRYYRFAKELVERVIDIADPDATQQKKQITEQTLTTYKERLPELILYSRRGEEGALSALKGLANLENFSTTVAQITFHPDTGTIIKAKEITLDQTPSIVPEPPRPNVAITFAEEPTPEEKVAFDALSTTDPLDLVDTDSEVFHTLTSLREKQNKLEEQDRSLITNLTEEPSLGGTKTEKLQATVEDAHELENALQETLTAFTSVHGSTEESLRTFSAYLKASGWDQNLPSTIAEQISTPQTYTPQRSTEELFAAIEAAENLAAIETIVDEMQRVLEASFSNDPQERFTNENLFTRHLLDKIGNFLLSPNHASTHNAFSTKDRATLTRILNKAGVGNRQEAEFYLQEFDLLAERYRAPSEENIASEELETQLSNFPITQITSDDPTNQRHLGRMGQQLVMEAGLEPVSETRDEKLFRAIDLLSQSTKENRKYWTEILEARRLLTETPKKQVLENLRGSLGFFSDDKDLYLQIRYQFSHYIFALQKLNQQASRGGLNVRFEHFRKNQESNLTELNNMAQTLTLKGSQLIQSLQTYTHRLESYLKDYKEARQEGMFVTNNNFHTQTLLKLEKNLQKIKAMLPDFETVASEIVSTGQTYSKIANTELARLKKRIAPSREASKNLEKNTANIKYPDLTAFNLGAQLAEVLEENISPFPAKS